MTSGAALKQGFGLALKSRPAVWILLAANLAVAALAALPIYRGIMNSTAHSLMSGELLFGFSPDWLTDFSFNAQGSLDRYARWILTFGLLSIPLNSILAGGVLAQFRSAGMSFSPGEFVRDTGRFAWRLIRLMLIGLFFYWVVFRLFNQGLGNLIGKWTRDWLDDRPVFWVRLGDDLLVLAGIGFVNLVMDFARIKLVLDDRRSAAEAFLAGLGFSLGRFRRAVAVFAFPALCGIALLGVYRLAVPWRLIHEPLAVALLFISQQIVMFGRYWFRVAAWASEWSYVASSRVEAHPAAASTTQ